MKSGGKVQYSVVLTTGATGIPSGSTLSLTTSSSSTPGIASYSDARCNSGSLADLEPGVAVPDESRGAGVNWTCVFSTAVTSDHQGAGMIAPFDVSLKYTGGNATVAHYIPKATTTEVPVYTGGFLTFDTQELVSGPDVFDGEAIPLLYTCFPRWH